MTDTFVSGDEELSAGQVLRKSREEQAVSLEEVAQVTRIAKSYLAALEDDAYEKLPSDAYVRGFLRVYANFLGLPVETVLCRYRPGTGEGLAEESEQEPSAVNRRSGNSLVSKRLFWSVSAVCLAAVAGFFLLDRIEQKDDMQETTVLTSPVTENAVVPTVQLPYTSGSKQGAPPQNTMVDVAVPTTQPEVSDSGVILKIKALEDGSLDLTIDETISQHYDLKAGDLIEWKGEKVFYLDLENAGGVEAELNGKLLKSFGEKGVPAHVVLSAGYDGGKTAP